MRHGGALVIDLSVVIVSWCSKEYLKSCLAAVPRGAGKLAYEICVVDNNSPDGSADMVRDEFPAVRLIRNDVNRGFAAANNQGLRKAIGRYALLLNPDTCVHEGALEKAVGFMDEHEGAGACGCLLLNEDGSVQHAVRRFPTCTSALAAKTILGTFGLFRKSYERVKMRGERFDRVMEVDQPSGAALFLRRSALDKVGLLDEGFFIFFEEVDLCRRIRDAGYKIYFVPDARITHFGGRSRRRNRAGIIRPGAESLLRYFRKHEPRFKSACFELVFRPLFVFGLCAEMVGAMSKAGLYRFVRGDSKKARYKEEIAGACAGFLKGDCVPFLLCLWE
jgi:GT2 family glycosyltransferase